MQALTRRRFLLWASATIGTCAAAWGGARLVGGTVPDVQGLRALTARQYATLHAVVRTVFPRGPLVNDPYSFATEVATMGDARLSRLPSYVATQLGAALVYVEAGPVLLERQLRTFSQLDDTARAKHWARFWEETSDDLRRGAGIGLRRTIGVWAYDTPSLWPAMHYTGPVVAPFTSE